ncbi:MAG: hypothetical protein R3D84_03540 [Paracoccaceae bacterium]
MSTTAARAGVFHYPSIAATVEGVKPSVDASAPVTGFSAPEIEHFLDPIDAAARALLLAGYALGRIELYDGVTRAGVELTEWTTNLYFSAAQMPDALFDEVGAIYGLPQLVVRLTAQALATPDGGSYGLEDLPIAPVSGANEEWFATLDAGSVELTLVLDDATDTVPDGAKDRAHLLLARPLSHFLPAVAAMLAPKWQGIGTSPDGGLDPDEDEDGDEDGDDLSVNGEDPAAIAAFLAGVPDVTNRGLLWVFDPRSWFEDADYAAWRYAGEMRTQALSALPRATVDVAEIESFLLTQMNADLTTRKTMRSVTGKVIPPFFKAGSFRDAVRDWDRTGTAPFAKLPENLVAFSRKIPWLDLIIAYVEAKVIPLRYLDTGTAFDRDFDVPPLEKIIARRHADDPLKVLLYCEGLGAPGTPDTYGLLVEVSAVAMPHLIAEEAGLEDSFVLPPTTDLIEREIDPTGMSQPFVAPANRPIETMFTWEYIPARAAAELDEDGTYEDEEPELSPWDRTHIDEFDSNDYHDYDETAPENPLGADATTAQFRDAKPMLLIVAGPGVTIKPQACDLVDVYVIRKFDFGIPAWGDRSIRPSFSRPISCPPAARAPCPAAGMRMPISPTGCWLRRAKTGCFYPISVRSGSTRNWASRRPNLVCPRPFRRLKSRSTTCSTAPPGFASISTGSTIAATKASGRATLGSSAVFGCSRRVMASRSAGRPRRFAALSQVSWKSGKPR